MFRRLGTSLANHRASLSSELGSLWDFLRSDRDRERHPSHPHSHSQSDRDRERRRSAPAACEHDSRSPSRLARDLLQVVQETVFAKKFDDRRCPLVKEESDLSSEECTDRRIANLIDFFFTIVKSQKDERKSSGGSCFRTESPTEVKPRKVNLELEKKMETLMEFLATTGCMEDDGVKDEKKITLMEFLFGPDSKPIVDINQGRREMTLSESNINVKLSYIDETPVEERSDLVEMLIKYMEDYEKEPSKCTLTPSLSEKSKSDVTISKVETFSDISKTKSDSTLTHTQETVIEREDIKSDKSRRISETVVDLSNIKQDLEDIFAAAVLKIAEMSETEEHDDDTMSESEDMQNFHSYTKPMLYDFQGMPYSVELSDIIEEDESLDPSSRGNQEDRIALIRECAEDLLDDIEDQIQRHFEGDSSEDEFDISASLKRSSISLIDLRSIPDLPPSMIIKPKVVRVDKSTSTTEISDSISDLSRRVDSGCMTEDTTLSNSSERQAERALDKLESLHKFFSRSRLEIISESHEEEKNEKKKTPKEKKVPVSENKSSELKQGQASLDDVEELQDEVLDINIEADKRNDVIEEENDREVDEEMVGEERVTNENKELDSNGKDKLSIDENLEENSTEINKIIINEGKEQVFVNSEEKKLNNDVNIKVICKEINVLHDELLKKDENSDMKNDKEDIISNYDNKLGYNENNVCIAESESDKVIFGTNDIAKAFIKNDKVDFVKNDSITKNNKIKNASSNNEILNKNSQSQFAKMSAHLAKTANETLDLPKIDFYTVKNKHKKPKLSKSVDCLANNKFDKDFTENCHKTIETVKETEFCQNPVKSNVSMCKRDALDSDDKDISETDFTEIDKIISEAVKIILANELEFHSDQKKTEKSTVRKEKKTEKLNNTNPHDFDRDFIESRKDVKLKSNDIQKDK